ncbi:hypothetical protein [Bradyrhizobium sp. dw_411]|uniref:hypothetical protein n=1 Tax=Bradyrhizobium sp. dw_411 TaxID=2720082 RepID=UPI001BCF22B9|nr:hypothetical protein [Bradyrhizobium sp. dw_411]
MTAAKTYPSWRLAAKTITINAIRENGSSGVAEMVASTAEPKNMIGSSTITLKRIASVDPISMLQIASIIIRLVPIKLRRNLALAR